MNVWEKQEIWKRYLDEICGNEEMAPLAGRGVEDWGIEEMGKMEMGHDAEEVRGWIASLLCQNWRQFENAVDMRLKVACRRAR